MLLTFVEILIFLLINKLTYQYNKKKVNIIKEMNRIDKKRDIEIIIMDIKESDNHSKDITNKERNLEENTESESETVEWINLLNITRR